MLIGVKDKKYALLKGLEMNELLCDVGFRCRSTQPTDGVIRCAIAWRYKTGSKLKPP